MNNRTLELLAVSALIGECDSLTASGDLNESQEKSLRLLVAGAKAAFRFQTQHERAVDNVVELFPRQLGCADEAFEIPPEFADDNYDRLIRLLESHL